MTGVRTRRALAALGSLALICWAALAAASHRPDPVGVGTAFAVLAACWIAMLVAWHLTRRADTGRPWALILGGAVAFRVAGLFAEPALEDDHFRFLWDGYRFAISGNPYATVPADHFADPAVPEPLQRVLDSVNNPVVATIYGPLCQWAFRLSHAVMPGSLLPWKAMLIAADLAVLLLLARDTGPAGALLYGWCPLPVFETAFNAHPEAIGVLALVLAVRWTLRNKGAWAGAGLAAAAGVKLTAGLLAPLLLARTGWRGAIGLAAGAGLLWGPFWIRGSAAEWPAVAEMSRTWEFNSSVFGLVAWLAGRSPAAVVALVGALAVLAWHLSRWRRGNEWPRGDQLFGALLLLAPVVNPWYLLWILPFAVIRPTAWSLTAMAMTSLSYLHGLHWGGGTLAPYEHPWWLRPLEYGLIAAAAWAGRDWIPRAREVPA